jgi:hypothetical protein
LIDPRFKRGRRQKVTKEKSPAVEKLLKIYEQLLHPAWAGQLAFGSNRKFLLTQWLINFFSNFSKAGCFY